MSKVLVTESSLAGIAEAIRAKSGSSDTYTPGQMAAAIEAIPTGVTPTGTVNITQNGTVNVTDYASAAVAVPNSYAAGDEGKVVSGGALVAQTARASQITENGTYDTTDNNSVTVNVSGGGGGSIVFYDYALFDGNGYLELDYTLNADYKITVDFQCPTYYNNNAVIGNNSGSDKSHFTSYSNKWYCSTGNGETSFTGDLTGRHVFVNNSNGKNLFDGTEVTDYTPTTDNNVKLQIGARRWANNLKGKIYGYKIESISAGTTLLNLVPAAATVVYNGNTLSSFLYDTVNDKLYFVNGITVGNDE